MKKYSILALALIMSILCLTGCRSKDDMGSTMVPTVTAPTAPVSTRPAEQTVIPSAAPTRPTEQTVTPSGVRPSETTTR